MSQRIVFDTSTVVSALVFDRGRLGWLRGHWREGGCIALASRDTAAELLRVLGYPKFRRSVAEGQALLADYLPYCEVIDVLTPCLTQCRDPKDQPFLDLAESGNAESLVSGDKDLLALAGKTTFRIEAPETYRQRVMQV